MHASRGRERCWCPHMHASMGRERCLCPHMHASRGRERCLCPHMHASGGGGPPLDLYGHCQLPFTVISPFWLWRTSLKLPERASGLIVNVPRTPVYSTGGLTPTGFSEIL